jgi:hypothetical protein
MYTAELEGKSVWDYSVREALGPVAEHKRMLGYLQEIHDMFPPEIWATSLTNLETALIAEGVL